MKKGKLYIGTSGWHYKHWKGTFYPGDIRDSEQFGYYLKFFDTVEINNSFYKLPSPETFSAWRKASKKDFVFAVKASRYITHMKKLNVDKNSIRIFFSHVAKLREKTGPILFQLTPRWNLNAERLAEFLPKLPRKKRYTFEFRNPSWYDERIYSILEKHNAAFCIYELEHHMSPIKVTANFVYIRLHGPGKKYQGNYDDESLKKWAVQLDKWQKEGKDVYVYFDNDQEGYAAFNAIRLIELTQKKKSQKKKITMRLSYA